MLVDASQAQLVIGVNYSAYSDPLGDLELQCLANSTTKVVEAFPTSNSRQLVLGVKSDVPVTVVIRKFFKAGNLYVDATTAIGAGNSIITDTALLEFAEIYITTAGAQALVHVTAIARP